MSILIQNGTLFLPEGPVRADLRVEGGCIAAIGPGLPAGDAQILDAAGKELYTVTDSGAVAEIDALINKAGGENADHGNAEGDPLYTYVYWQETTLHAGEDPDAEREYLEVFRTQVRQGSNAVTTEVLSDTLEGVGSFVGVEGLGGLLTFTAEVPRETADALRDPAQFAGA